MCSCMCSNYSGLVVYSEGPLNLDHKPEDMSELFRPFHTLLRKIRQVIKDGCNGFSSEEKIRGLKKNTNV